MAFNMKTSRRSLVLLFGVVSQHVLARSYASRIRTDNTLEVFVDGEGITPDAAPDPYAKGRRRKFRESVLITIFCHANYAAVYEVDLGLLSLYLYCVSVLYPARPRGSQ